MATKEEQISKVLAEIGSRVPKNILKAAFTEQDKTPTIKFVMQQALYSKSVSSEKKQKIRALIDSGEFDKKKMVENPKYVKMLDNYWGREINKAMKSGRLPRLTKEEVSKLPGIKQLYDKAGKN